MTLPLLLGRVCRAPYGARGLKPLYIGWQSHAKAPRPVRGAWVETRVSGWRFAMAWSRAPYGARGLKPPT